MAEKRWVGGASRVAQVDIITMTATAGGWNDADQATVTLRKDGNAGTETITATMSSPANAEAARDTLLSELQSGTGLFSTITWAALATEWIKGTAKVSGVPFFSSISDTSTGANASITNDGSASSVLSEGPEDYNVDGSGNYTGSNWVDSGGAVAVKPATNDDAKAAEGSFSIMYGLDQSSGATYHWGTANRAVSTFRTGPGFTGDVGDAVNGHSLILSATGSGDKAVVINGRGKACLLNTTCPDVYVLGGQPNSPNLLKLKGDVDNLRILGAEVAGTITCADSMTLDNVVFIGAPAGVLNVGTSIASFDSLFADGGSVVIESAVASTVTVWGNANVIHKGSATTVTVATWNAYGGTSEYRGPGTLTTLNVRGGIFDLRKSEASAVTISTANVFAGLLVDRGGLVNVTYSTLNVYKGQADISKGTPASYV